MTVYADLQPCYYFDRDLEWGGTFSSSLKAVGWLGTEADFATGPIPMGVRDRLEVLADDPWEPWVLMGFHCCGLCAPNDSRMQPDACGGSNVFIPGAGYVYAAPELIRHYIDAHQYRPPTEFCDAVLACPPMGSSAYFDALLRNASGDFRNIIVRDLENFDDRKESERRRLASDRPSRL
jgi:hypothetical protein